MKIFDYQCPQCQGIYTDILVTPEEETHVLCSTCSITMHKLISTPHLFETIIPTYPGAKRQKAGYQHKYINRPATKPYITVPHSITEKNS